MRVCTHQMAALREMTSWPPYWKYGVGPYLYLKNFRAKFHSDMICNDGAFGFFEEFAPNKLKKKKNNNNNNNNKMSSNVRSVSDLKMVGEYHTALWEVKVKSNSATSDCLESARLWLAE